MNSFDNGGPLDQLFARARELAHEAPEVKRRKVIDFVMARIAADGTKERVARFMVERIYDRVFGTPEFEKNPATATPSPRKAPGAPDTNLCPHCGLNDGHHYVGCQALKEP